MTRYAVGGYEEFPVLFMRPVTDGTGMEIPDHLYERWRRARAELDAAQRAVLAYIRTTLSADAVPPSLRDSQDYPEPEHPSERSWHLS